MAPHPFVIIDRAESTVVSAHVDADGVRLPAEAVRAAIGWEVQPQGLCRGEACVPLPAGAGVDPRGLELTALAGALCRLRDQRGRKVMLVAYASW